MPNTTTFRKLRAFCRVLRMKKRWDAGIGDHNLRTHVKGELTSFCPLTYACYAMDGTVLSANAYLRAGDRLGFNETESREIAHAADIGLAMQFGASYKLRRILERACGIRKEPS